MAGPPRPRPWVQGEPRTVGADDVTALTVPAAWQLLQGVIGYHAPRKLRDAELLLSGLRQGQ
jgi:hypothetical protein